MDFSRKFCMGDDKIIIFMSNLDLSLFYYEVQTFWITFAWLKQILNRDFALAREIIDDRENAHFSRIFNWS